MKRAFAEKSIVKGIICHGMWLISAAPELVRGRPVVAHNNLIGDVRNMGVVYTDQDVVIDDDLVTARTGGHCHLFARAIIDLIVERSAPAGSNGGQRMTAASTAGTAGATTTATAGTPAATGPGASVPTNVERFAASSPTTAAGAATPTAAGSGSAAPVHPNTSTSAVPGRRLEANMPAAAGPGAPTPIPPAPRPPAGA
jgi:hypothetical protein